ncbi:hypothetical protein AYI70_g5948 [Smittium culicis]|uniref:Uncharacterized protein n=1 Tax=Smittium culicis TaxID=133412 RepID=A0A1R1XSA1_9FUNG|nr:hypothetical protein AYI70_g5948 [Smittium culicis]
MNDSQFSTNDSPCISKETTKFLDLSPSGKSKNTKLMHDYALKVSKFGKDLLKSLNSDFKQMRMALNILSLHNSLEKNSLQKSNILALVADVYSRKELRDIGYKIKTSKLEIYQKIISEDPNLLLGLSTFYRLCPKNFKKSKKRTDMCPICINGEKNLKRLRSLDNSGTAVTGEIRDKLQYEINNYEGHKEIKKKQIIAYKSCLNKLESNECVVIMDFKENFRIGGGPVEIGANFYSKSLISDLCFAVIYKKTENRLGYKYFNYLSEILSHDSKYVSECLSDLMKDQFMDQFSNVHLWSDSGPHFRSQELLYSIFFDFDSDFEKNFTLNFFAEYHGKSLVDGHFGCLSRWFSQGELGGDILDINQLIEVFESSTNRGRLTSQNPVDAVFRIYHEHKPRYRVNRLLVKGFKSYMSFGNSNNGLVGCPVSTLSPCEYVSLIVKIDEKRDKRVTKYSIPQQNPISGEVILVMGPQSQSTQALRLTLIQDIFSQDSASVYYGSSQTLPSVC